MPLTRDEQARTWLVEIARGCAAAVGADLMDRCPLCDPQMVRAGAGFPDSMSGPWDAAGLAAAMADAGLVVPAAGTEARREAIALLDFVVHVAAGRLLADRHSPHSEIEAAIATTQPGDIIAWRNPDHVAVIIAVDDDSITIVEWDEGKAPGRVRERRLWRTHYMAAPRVPPENTVLHHYPGGLHGITRPVAR